MSVTESLTTFGRQLSVGGGGVRRGGNGRGRGGGLGGGNNPGQGGGGGGIWTPSLLSPLPEFWLDADDASTITITGSGLSEWRSKGATTIETEQGADLARPPRATDYQNSRDCINFVPNDVLTPKAGTGKTNCLNNATGGMFYCVFRHAVPTSGNVFGTLFSTRTHSGDATSNNGAEVQIDNNSSNRRLVARVTSQNSTIAEVTTNLSLFTINTWALVSIAFDPGNAIASEKIKVRLNDLTQWATNIQTGAVTATAALAPRIGGRSSLSAAPHPYTGHIAEMIITPGIDSDANRQRMVGYLAHRWGLTSLLDVSHPFKSSPPTA